MLKLLFLILPLFLSACGGDDPSLISGGVSINGTPLDGNTLTVSDSAGDTDGINDSFYSWYQNGSVVSSSGVFVVPYLPTNASLYVRKSYTDDDGKDKFFNSSTITIIGAAVPSNDSFSIIEDGSFLLNILSNDTNTQEQTINLAPPTNSDVVTSISNNNLSIQTLNNFHGSFVTSYTLSRNGKTSVPATISTTITPTNDPHTGSMVINGTPETGLTLTFTDTVSDVDGQSAVSYGWKLDGAEISTSNSLIITESMVGKQVIVFKKYNDTFADRVVESSPITIGSSVQGTIDSLPNPIGNIPADSPTGAFSPTTTEYELSNSFSGLTIFWDGSNSDINFLREEAGKTFINIPRPNANSSDKTINLIAKTTVGGTTYSKTFPILVPKKATRSTKQLVIRVKFSDSDFHSSSSESYEEDRMFNDTTMGDIDNYSVNGFFYENSSHRSKLIRAVMPVVDNSGMTNGSVVDADLNDGVLEYHATFPRPFSRYPSFDITKYILNDIDSYVDFSSFDTNNNNKIESTELNILFNYAICNRASSSSVCYPGPTGTNDYTVQGFWPAATTSYFIDTDDGVRVGGSGTSRITWVTDYIIYNSAPSVKILQDDFNIVAHELGHNLYESPDLYNGNSSLSIMYWGLMGQSYAQYNGKYIPQHMTAHQKITRGLTDPSISTPYSRSRTGNYENLVLTNQITDNSNRLVVVSNENTMSNIYSKQYFSLGMRSRDSGFDRGLQRMSSFTPGVLISHIAPYRPQGNSSANDYWSLNNNIVTNDQLENTSHSSGSTSLFRDGQVIDGATKFHINTYSLPLIDKEHVVNTNIQIDINKIGDDTFNIQLRSTQ